MTERWLTELLAVLLAVLLFLLLLGIFCRSVQRFLISILSPLPPAAARLHGDLDQAVTRLREGGTRELQRIGLSEVWRPAFAIGALVHSSAFLLFFGADLTWLALQFKLIDSVPGGLRHEWIVLLPLVLGISYGFWMAKELFWTPQLTPVVTYKKLERFSLGGAAVLVGLLAFSIGLVLAAERLEIFSSEALADPAVLSSNADPLAQLEQQAQEVPELGPWETRAVAARSIGVFCLGALGSAVSLKPGPALLLELLPALAHWMLALATSLLRIAAAALHGLVTFISGFCYVAGAGLIKVGVATARPVITPFRRVSDWALERRRSKQQGRDFDWLGVTAETLSSWSYDIELPEAPIGTEAGLDGLGTDAPPSDQQVIGEQRDATKRSERGGPAEHGADRGGTAEGTVEAEGPSPGANHNFDPLGWDPHLEDEPREARS